MLNTPLVNDLERTKVDVGYAAVSRGYVRLGGLPAGVVTADLKGVIGDGAQS
jgi:hypothetical protein